MVASQLPELPTNSESRGVADSLKVVGLPTPSKWRCRKALLDMEPPCQEVVTGPSSSCPRVLGACEPSAATGFPVAAWMHKFRASWFVSDWEVLFACVRGRTKNPPTSHELWTLADFAR